MMDIENVIEIEVDTSSESSIPTEVEKAGPAGLSAYQIAVKDGFVGTEEEWLASLKGDPGETGATGQPGPQGLPGRDGAIQYTAGDNITIDENNVISATGGDLSNYYTKSEIENKIIELDLSISNTTYWTNKGQEIVNAQFGNSSYLIKTTDGDIVGIGTLKTNKIILSAYVPSTEQFTETGNIYGVKYTSEKLWRITINFNADTKIVSSVSRSQFFRNISEATSLSEQPLTTGNTSAYTPTGNYNPATKKYVDDSIASKIWIGTQTEYDNLSSYSDSTVYFIKEDTNASE